MTAADKTQVITIKVQVPTRSPQDAAEKWLPKLMAATTALEVPEGTPPVRIRGVSIGAGR